MPGDRFRHDSARRGRADLRGIGATLVLPNAQGINEPVIGTDTFGAVVIMVMVTTLVTPPLLKWSLSRRIEPSTRVATKSAPPRTEAVEKTAE